MDNVFFADKKTRVYVLFSSIAFYSTVQTEGNFKVSKISKNLRHGNNTAGFENSRNKVWAWRLCLQQNWLFQPNLNSLFKLSL